MMMVILTIFSLLLQWNSKDTSSIVLLKYNILKIRFSGLCPWVKKWGKPTQLSSLDNLIFIIRQRSNPNAWICTKTFTSMGDYSSGHRIVDDQLTGMDDGIVLLKPMHPRMMYICSSTYQLDFIWRHCVLRMLCFNQTVHSRRAMMVVVVVVLLLLLLLLFLPPPPLLQLLLLLLLLLLPPLLLLPLPLILLLLVIIIVRMI